jgi:hypothetical protein
MEDRRRFRSSEELAFANIGGALPSSLPSDHVGPRGQVIQQTVGGDQARRIQAGIDQAMREMISKDIRHNPVTSGAGPATVRPAGAGVVRSGPVIRGTGWHDPGPLQSEANRSTATIIDALADSFQPHGVGNPQRREPKRKEP